METVSIKKSERNIGIDLLRILSMLMVVLLHILGKGGILDNAVPLSLNYNIAYLIEIAAYCSVNCYALVSGYVGLNSRHRFSSVSMLWLQVVFYCVTITTAMYFFYPQLVNWKSFVKALFPVTFSSYWYFTAYFGMWFFMPIMNAAVNNLSKKQMGLCLISGGIVIFPISLLTDSFKLGGGYGILWLVFLYLTGAYFSKHKILDGINSKICLLTAVLSVLVSWSAKLLFVKLLGTDNFFDSRIMNYVSPLVFLESVALFTLFLKLKMSDRFSKTVLKLSPLCFSVYLIHTHPLVFNNVFADLFSELANVSVYVMVMGVVAVAIAVFVICIAIDFLRHLLFKVLQIQKILSMIEEKVDLYAEKLIKKF